MTIHPTTPARAARRQLLRDRFAEYLTEHGAQHGDDYARDLIAIVDDLGFALPAAIDDPPTAAGRSSDPDHRRACMEQIRATLHRPHDPDRPY